MASVSVLQPVKENGWRRGFANLLRKENGEWWRTSRWWTQSLVWLLIVNGFTALGVWVAPAVDPAEVRDTMINLGIFIEVMVWFPMFAVIVRTQGAVIGEKQSGTAAWIMSAPASRSAFILAKLVANAIGFFVTLILVQGVVAYVQLSLFDGSPLPLVPYLTLLALLSLYLLFYLTLTMMLGAFFGTRGPVLAIAIGVAVSSIIGIGNLFARFLPWIVVVLPESIHGILTRLVQEVPLPDDWHISIILMFVYSLVFIALAIWRFRREEF